MENGALAPRTETLSRGHDSEGFGTAWTDFVVERPNVRKDISHRQRGRR